MTYGEILLLFNSLSIILSKDLFVNVEIKILNPRLKKHSIIFVIKNVFPVPGNPSINKNFYKYNAFYRHFFDLDLSFQKILFTFKNIFIFVWNLATIYLILVTIVFLILLLYLLTI